MIKKDKYYFGSASCLVLFCQGQVLKKEGFHPDYFTLITLNIVVVFAVLSPKTICILPSLTIS